jgi:hypothetical protein
MAGIILRFSPASIIAAAWSARESEKQVRLGGIIPDEIHASDLSEARFQQSVKCGELLCARSIVPFEGSRWRCSSCSMLRPVLTSPCPAQSSSNGIGAAPSQVEDY